MLKFHFEKIGEGHQKSLVILHGFMESSEESIKLAQDLSEYFDCYLIDLPGHGKSKDLLNQFPTIESIALEINKWAKSLVSPHLFGYSMGGRIGFAISSIKYCPFVKMFIESANPGLIHKNDIEQRRLHDQELFKDVTTQDQFESFLREWYQRPLFHEISKASNFEIMLKRKIKNNQPRKMAATLTQYGLAEQDNYWEQLRSPSCASMYISGEKDEKYLAINKKMSSLGWNTALIKNSGHATHFENYQGFLNQFMKFMS